MRIHHVNCGILRPYGGRFLDGYSHGQAARFVSHCWIIETNEGLVLVDTGLGMEDVRQPEHRINALFRKFARPSLNGELTARRHVERLGFQTEDVRHILLTHMDFDVAGGISDFPQAQVHVMRDEWNAAIQRRSWLDRRRYRPVQWQQHAFWNFYDAGRESWFGFPCVKLNGLSEDIHMVALPGHSAGHAGVAVRTRAGWMLHAGDAYMYRQELEREGYRCPMGLRLFERAMETNHRDRMATLRKLRDLVFDHEKEVRVCSSYDAIELSAYQAQQVPLREQYEIGHRPRLVTP